MTGVAEFLVRNDRPSNQAKPDRRQPLAQHPRLGHEGRPGLPADVRELVLNANYIAVYRVIDTSRTVEILRVKHVAQQTP